MTDTPLELRGIEARLGLLHPAADADLVQAVTLFSAISCANREFLRPSSLPQFSRFVRLSQFRAALCGILLGLLLGIPCGGLGVFCALPDSRVGSFDVRCVGRLSPGSAHVPEAEGDLARSVCRIVRYYQGIPELCQYVE